MGMEEGEKREKFFQNWQSPAVGVSVQREKAVRG